MKQNYTVKFLVLERSEAVLRQNEPIHAVISPTFQALVQYTYEDSLNTEAKFLLTVNRTQSFTVCSVVSIQPIENEVKSNPR